MTGLVWILSGLLIAVPVLGFCVIGGPPMGESAPHLWDYLFVGSLGYCAFALVACLFVWGRSIFRKRKKASSASLSDLRGRHVLLVVGLVGVIMAVSLWAAQSEKPRVQLSDQVAVTLDAVLWKEYPNHYLYGENVQQLASWAYDVLPKSIVRHPTVESYLVRYVYLAASSFHRIDGGIPNQIKLVFRYQVPQQWLESMYAFEFDEKIKATASAAIRVEYGNGRYSPFIQMSSEVKDEFGKYVYGTIDLNHTDDRMIDVPLVPATQKSITLLLYNIAEAVKSENPEIPEPVGRLTLSNPLYSGENRMSAEAVTTGPVMADGVSVTLEGLYSRVDPHAIDRHANHSEMEYSAENVPRLSDPERVAYAGGSLAVWRIEEPKNPENLWSVSGVSVSYDDPAVEVRVHESTFGNQGRSVSVFGTDLGAIGGPVRLKVSARKNSGFGEDEVTSLTFVMPPPKEGERVEKSVQFWDGEQVRSLTWKSKTDALKEFPFSGIEFDPMPGDELLSGEVKAPAKATAPEDDWVLYMERLPAIDEGCGDWTQVESMTIEGAGGLVIDMTEYLVFGVNDFNLTGRGHYNWATVRGLAGGGRAALDDGATVTIGLKNVRRVTEGLEFIATPVDATGAGEER